MTNVVAILSGPAPRLNGWLQIPLTTERALRLADFCARHGVDAQALVLDLLDDVIFDTGLVVSGGVSCMEPYRSESQAPPKSPDKNAGPHANLRFETSRASPSSSGPTKPPPLSPASCTTTQASRSAPEQPSAGCQARSIRRSVLSTSPIGKSSGDENDNARP